MTLFVILICFGIQRLLHVNGAAQNTWLANYTRFGLTVLHKWQVEGGMVNFILLLLPIFLLVFGVSSLLHGVWLGSLLFLFSLVVLFYALDARNLRSLLSDYLAASQKGDEQAAFRYGSQFLEMEAAADRVVLTRSVTRQIFLHAERYVFFVLFWYILLGPVGAAICAFVNYVSDPARLMKQPGAAGYLPASFLQAADFVFKILNWIPSRLVGLTYALVGHFGSAMGYWRAHIGHSFHDSPDIALESAMATLELDGDLLSASIEENQMALDLVDRGIVLWIVGIALCTLVAWIA